MEDLSGAGVDSANDEVMSRVAARGASAPAPAKRLRTVRRETPWRSARARPSKPFCCMVFPFRRSAAGPTTMLRPTLIVRLREETHIEGTTQLRHWPRERTAE